MREWRGQLVDDMWIGHLSSSLFTNFTPISEQVTFQLGDGGQDGHVAAAADEISSDHYLLQIHAQVRGWGKKTRRIISFLISTLAWEKIPIFLHQAN
jgi:hypothetical protein